MLLVLFFVAGCGTQTASAPQPTTISTPTSLLPASTPTPPLPTSTLPYTPTRWLDGIPCRPPCWEGITPGQTTPEQAFDILVDHPLLGEVQIVEGSGLGEIEWTWNDGSDGGQVMYDGEGITNTIEAISWYGAKFRLKDIIAAYGEPTHIFAWPQRINQHAVYGVRLIYQDQGFTLDTVDTQIKPIIDQNLIVEPPHFFDPANIKDLFFNDMMLAWEGFQSFDYYCRDKGGTESCAAFDLDQGYESIVATEQARPTPVEPMVIAENVPITLTGYYRSGFETSTFEPCSRDELWWIGLVSLDTHRYEVTQTEYAPVFVRLTGLVSEVGEYGHLNLYTRTFLVYKLLEMRQPAAGDCQEER